MTTDATRIAIPPPVLDDVDLHLHLFRTFSSRQELLSHAILDFLQRAEENFFGAQ